MNNSENDWLIKLILEKHNPDQETELIKMVLEKENIIDENNRNHFFNVNFSKALTLYMKSELTIDNMKNLVFLAYRMVESQLINQPIANRFLKSFAGKLL